ncbi:MAG TPA: TIR domain-containing protein [Candidatus Kapabacteria bacterium]|nr:TIR domain-containing protein [Candidatus Kapabacteria bacterium]
MSPSIFISYCREDEKHAMHLLAMLRREGHSVWIDQEAIAGASIWSDEIVQNIKRSQIFIALLSASSVTSANVAKEIALAAENGKIILPIEIGSVELPGRLEYALAGIQKTSFADEEAILHAVRSQVARLEGTEPDDAAHSRFLSRARRHRYRMATVAGAAVLLAAGLFLFLRPPPDPAGRDNAVVVLPFETLNLDQDSTRNLDIFSEDLLTRLASLKTLTTVGASVSAEYKNSGLNALAIAKALKARFTIEGLVRKSHDVSFVSVRIIDAKKGGEIWEHSYSGNNSELFSIRDRVSSDLTGILYGVTSDEAEVIQAEQDVAKHPNDAKVCAKLATMLLASDKTRSFNLFQRAIELDSSNIAYYVSAGIVAERNGTDPKPFGRLAAALCAKRMASYPDSVNLTATYAISLDLAGSHGPAQEIYDSLLRRNPSDVRLNYNAACCFAKQGRADSAVAILKRLFVFAPGKRGEVQSDPDFDNIRSFPGYQTLMYGSAP